MVALPLAAVPALICVACAATAPTEAPSPPTITYPFDEALFPPDFPPPTFRWESTSGRVESWAITVGREGGEPVTARSSATQWTPSEEQWGAIQKLSLGKSVTVTVGEARGQGPGDYHPGSSIDISTSTDAVGASLFYREVNLPFVDAVKDPTHIRWRYGSISAREPPPVVLEKLPVCGNCHSFSADASIMGMDVDYANDKGSYTITRVAREIPLDRESIISWADYRREDGELTFGLLSQVSPDGRYVVSTVNDRSVFVPMPDLAFSQLFFPVKGILAVYDRQAKSFVSLAGADDPALVQSNPSWSPDGEQLLFARSKAHHLKNIGDKLLLSREDCREFTEGGKTFLYDIYRVPFNGGKGGRPEPLPGASDNGMSNFFPRYSPDGRWIVFCKAKSFMLLQPDSELYIMPAAGGEPRRMKCNQPRMNSWHSWSPNSRWLVFSSKPEGPYTQLFLTHVDDEGRSSPPVLLERLVSEERAANIPEFVAAAPDAIQKLREMFVDEVSYMRAGVELLQGNAPREAERAFRRALEINPSHADTLNNLGFVLMHTGRRDEARGLLEKAVQLQPDAAEANNNLGFLLVSGGSYTLGKAHLTRYLGRNPDDHVAHNNLGYALEKLGRSSVARSHYEKSLELRPDYPKAHCTLGRLLQQRGEEAAAAEHLAKCR